MHDGIVYVHVYWLILDIKIIDLFKADRWCVPNMSGEFLTYKICSA